MFGSDDSPGYAEGGARALKAEGSRVVAVVVTHNRPEYLLKVVAALQAQTRPPDLILVLDNASFERADRVLEPATGLVCLRSENNLGGAGGFALGLKHAIELRCDWVWLMDDDAVPRPYALACLMGVAHQSPPRAAALCSAVFEFGRLARMHRRRFGRALGLEARLPASCYETRLCEIDTGSFVGFMLRAQAVSVVGLPEPAFFLAYDDTEYSLRLKSAGWSLWLVPASRIDHLRSLGSRLRGSVFGVKHFYNIRNRIHVARRYSRWGLVPAVAFGVMIWLASSNPWARTSLGLFARAVLDGVRGALGKLEETVTNNAAL